MSGVTQTTAVLTDEVKTYYESKFLERAKHQRIYEEGAQKRTHKTGEGKVIQFDRYAPLATVTTPLTEGTNPAIVNISSSTTQVTLAEYGNTVKISKLLSLVSIDKDSAEKVSLLGQNMGETLDEVARNALFAGATVQLAGGKSALSDVAASDSFNAVEVAKATRTLEENKAMPYEDGFFMGKVTPRTKFSLVRDTTWINAKTYSDVKDLYEGEMGELYQVRFLLSTNPRTESSTTTVYSNFIHGANAFGTYNLEKDPPKLYIKVPGPQDTSNPADRYSTISWAGSYAAKVLIADWVLNVKTAGS